jgi:FKBP-type peptidyl-prolyl cis-trans isomerase FkpA
MKFVFALLVAVSFSAFAAEPAMQDAGKPAIDAAISKLSPKEPLPKIVKELTIIDRNEGDANGKTVTSGTPVLVQYTGWLYDPSKPDGKGAMFDTSQERPTPFGFIVGAGRVIKGWDKGLVGMKVNGLRTLIIPAALAYGEAVSPKIPANSNLIFDVEVVQIIGTAATPK